MTLNSSNYPDHFTSIKRAIQSEKIQVGREFLDIQKGDILATLEVTRGRCRDIVHIPLDGDIFTAKVVRIKSNEVVRQILELCYFVTIPDGITDLGELRTYLQSKPL